MAPKAGLNKGHMAGQGMGPSGNDIPDLLKPLRRVTRIKAVGDWMHLFRIQALTGKH